MQTRTPNNATYESDKKTCHNQSITSDFFLFCSLSNYLLCQKQLLKDNPLETTLLSYAILQLFFLYKKKKKSHFSNCIFVLPDFPPKQNPFFSLAWAISSPNDTFCGPSKATLGKKKVATTSKPPFLFLKLKLRF